MNYTVKANPKNTIAAATRPRFLAGHVGYVSKMGESTTRGLNKSPDLLTMQVLSEMII